MEVNTEVKATSKVWDGLAASGYGQGTFNMGYDV